MRRCFMAFFAFAALAASAQAETKTAPECRNGLFVEDGFDYALARIKGADNAFFIDDNAPCPNDTPACRTKTYVLSGDLVIAGRAFGPYRCIFYRNQKDFSGSAGYVPETRLEILPKADVSEKDWLGEWRMGDDFIKLRKARDGKLSASGEAYWPSANPSLKERPGGPNTGEMSGTAAPKGTQIGFADEEDICRVSLTLLPPFLLAKDNGSCGGANVTFSGVYLRPELRVRARHAR